MRRPGFAFGLVLVLVLVLVVPFLLALLLVEEKYRTTMVVNFVNNFRGPHQEAP